VQTGQLLFAGTPIDNPRLNIVAVRTVGDVNAGLRITGNAQNPQLAVFSDPPMGQANALAYVVTGKPLDQVGSSSGDSDALQSAARSMGSAAGGLLAKKIGGRLGIDEVGVKDSDAIGGSAFTVGQYLSPRLYLSYGIGLFQPGEVMTLRYKLKEGLAIQAERGPKDTRAGVEYRIEK
jgi:translocation and assembly module TamB